MCLTRPNRPARAGPIASPAASRAARPAFVRTALRRKPYPPNRVTPNTRARMMTKVSAVNTARLSQLNQTTGRDG